MSYPASLYGYLRDGDICPPFTQDGHRIYKATIKTGLAVSRRGGYVHVPNRTVVVWYGRQPQFAAQWMCREISPNIVPVDPDQVVDEQRCAICADAALGAAMYRFFDANGALLYIGSAERFLVRRTAHVRTSKWWHEVASESVDRYPTLIQARNAEVLAIRKENPKHNVHRRLKAVA